MIDRRALLLGTAAAVVPHAARSDPALLYGPELSFDVIRRDSRIGTHILHFTAVDQGFNIRIAVDIAIGLGPITFFRYTLRCLEQWRGGEVVHVDATTNDDGSHQWMQAQRDSQGLWVRGSKAARYLAPTDALPATHWNMAELRAEWINPQDGRLFHPTIRAAGLQPTRWASGTTDLATQYDVTGDVHLDIWYTAARRWCALTFMAKDGSLVRYQQA